MTPILQQFISESRDGLQSISEMLMQLETEPGNADLMGELFRLVHTLKGNSGLFDFPEMSRVLHAAEDLMAVVRDGAIGYSQALADRLLDAMDFVSMLLDEIEGGRPGAGSARYAQDAVRLAQALRELILPTGPAVAVVVEVGLPADSGPDLAALPVDLLQTLYAQAGAEAPLLWLRYRPEQECFFKGEDPFFLARQTPQCRWQRVSTVLPWPALDALDAYCCTLCFDLVSSAPRAELEAHFRYVPEQISLFELPRPQGLTSTLLAAQGPVNALTLEVMTAQLAVLSLPDSVAWLPGRLKAVVSTLTGCLRSLGQVALLPGLEAALAESLAQPSATPLHRWLQQHMPAAPTAAVPVVSPPASEPALLAPAEDLPALLPEVGLPVTDGETRFGRRAEDAAAGAGAKTLKVDQEKIDRLMSLIGEMVVAKNGLPYLASRAENVFGVRELSREIKTQYAVINRIAEEMQDAIMQVRMMPVSFVFQRFPRLVRDISRKLGKEVSLVLEGEDTEADKNIIEALADPLIHIVRNSLDHGLETPEVRRAAGKPAEGRLLICATQEAGRVVIDISDDGRGIDPEVIKRKAYEKGLIDEVTLERLSDQDAVNLVFAAGFSTAEVVSDLSGRGVGMDAVRAAVERVNGSVMLESQRGQGTRLRLSLPLSMAVTNVMIVESDGQIFGVPMDMVVETVRVRRSALHTIKSHQAAVLRGRIVPLRSLNELLASTQPQRLNEEDELALLVIRLQGEHVGIVVDEFREVVDIILKPMGGILGGLSGYTGSALLGDGSVLMVLNLKELL